jgi:hypothetical protein
LADEAADNQPEPSKGSAKQEYKSAQKLSNCRRVQRLGSFGFLSFELNTECGNKSKVKVESKKSCFTESLLYFDLFEILIKTSMTYIIFEA